MSRLLPPVILTAALFLTAPAAEGAWSFSRPSALSDMLIAIPMMNRARGLPLEPPRTHTYLPVRTSDSLTREDRFSPFELWYNDQHEARWQDEDGNAITIATVKCEFPDFPINPQTDDYRHVKLDDFRAECARAKWSISSRDLKKLQGWVADFVPAKIFAPERLDINSHALETLLRFPNDGNLLIYVFLPKSAGKSSSRRWIAVIAEPEKNNCGNAGREQFEKKFLGGIKPVAKSDDRKKAETERSLKLEKGAKNTFPYHPVREAAKKSILHHGDWWNYETEGYIVLSDLYSGIGKSVMRDLSEYLPPFRKILQKLLPPQDTQANDVFLIRIFARRESYLQYAGPQMQWSQAFWDPKRRELVMHNAGGEEETMPTLLHEATHQHISFAYAMIMTSPWFNEGHACLLSRFIPENGKAKVGIDDKYSMLLAANPETTALLLPPLLSLSYEEFYDKDIARKQFNYALAWGLCFYLQYGIKADNAPAPYSEILERYIKALARTRDAAIATEEAFADIDLAEFSVRFAEFWSRGDMAKKALRLNF